MLKGSKPHASTSRQSTDRLDNMSCIYISEWEYTFQVRYVLGGVRHLSTSTGGVIDVMEQSLARKSKCGSQYQDLSRYLSREFNLEGHNITICLNCYSRQFYFVQETYNTDNLD